MARRLVHSTNEYSDIRSLKYPILNTNNHCSPTCGAFNRLVSIVLCPPPPPPPPPQQFLVICCGRLTVPHASVVLLLLSLFYCAVLLKEQVCTSASCTLIVPRLLYCSAQVMLTSLPPLLPSISVTLHCINSMISQLTSSSFVILNRAHTFEDSNRTHKE